MTVTPARSGNTIFPNCTMIPRAKSGAAAAVILYAAAEEKSPRVISASPDAIDAPVRYRMSPPKTSTTAEFSSWLRKTFPFFLASSFFLSLAGSVRSSNDCSAIVTSPLRS